MADIPNPVVHRMTQYLAHVRRLREEGVEWVASHEIAEALGLTSSTVRQDLSHLEFSGTSRRGYETKRLEWVLYKELGADRIANAVIVGVGHLGRALALHGGFEREGFIVCAAVDASPRLHGKKVGAMTVQPMEELPDIVRDKKIDIGIVAVPTSAAQEVADALIAAGVRGLLNLTAAHVQRPAGIAVVDARIVAFLQELLYLMRRPNE